MPCGNNGRIGCMVPKNLSLTRNIVPRITYKVLSSKFPQYTSTDIHMMTVRVKLSDVGDFSVCSVGYNFSPHHF